MEVNKTCGCNSRKLVEHSLQSFYPQSLEMDKKQSREAKDKKLEHQMSSTPEVTNINKEMKEKKHSGLHAKFTLFSKSSGKGLFSSFMSCSNWPAKNE